MTRRLLFEFKGGRDYVHGTDIFNSLEDFAVDRGWYVGLLNFKKISTNHLELFLSLPEGAQKVVGGGKFLERGDGIDHSFWLVESDLPVTERYEFDEDSIIDRAMVKGEEVELLGMNSCTVIEHIIALTKKLNYVLAPDVDGKWLFGQIRLKCPLPEKARQFNIVRRHTVANRFSVNLLNVDGVDVGEVRFVVGRP